MQIRDQMIVLNGAEGLSDALAQALASGVTGLQMARNMLRGGVRNADPSGNGHVEPLSTGDVPPA